MILWYLHVTPFGEYYEKNGPCKQFIIQRRHTGDWIFNDKLSVGSVIVELVHVIQLGSIAFQIWLLVIVQTENEY